MATDFNQVVIRLGELRPALEAMARAENLKLSAYVRKHLQAVVDAAGTEDSEGNPAVAHAREPMARAYLPTSVALPQDVLSTMADRAKRYGWSRSQYLALAIRQVMETDEKWAARSSGLEGALRALVASNAQIAAVGRNLNQIAKSLNAYPGQTSKEDRETLAVVGEAVSQHLSQAGNAVDALWDNVKPWMARKKPNAGT